MYKNIKKKINRDVENVNNDNKYMYVKDVHDGCPTSSAAFKTLKKSFNKLFILENDSILCSTKKHSTFSLRFEFID